MSTENRTYDTEPCENENESRELIEAQEAYRQRIDDLRQRTARVDPVCDNWGNEDLESLLYCFNRQYGITEIAVHLGRTEPAVMRKIEDLDLYDRKHTEPLKPRKYNFTDESRDAFYNECFSVSDSSAK